MEKLRTLALRRSEANLSLSRGVEGSLPAPASSRHSPAQGGGRQECAETRKQPGAQKLAPWLHVHLASRASHMSQGSKGVGEHRSQPALGGHVNRPQPALGGAQTPASDRGAMSTDRRQRSGGHRPQPVTGTM